MDKRDTGITEILYEEMTRESLIVLSNTEPPKDPEVTRESLIALSFEEPQKDPATECFPDNNQNVIDYCLKCEEAERYRSELISLSYWPSSSEEPAPSVFSGGLLF